MFSENTRQKTGEGKRLRLKDGGNYEKEEEEEEAEMAAKGGVKANWRSGESERASENSTCAHLCLEGSFTANIFWFMHC